MSFHSWLQNLRSALKSSRRAPRDERGAHHAERDGYRRRGSLRAATYRPYVEVLEDRSLLSFSPVVSFPVGTNPQAVVTADFNNDGRVDLATTNSGSDTVSVLLGDGQGGFGAASHFATGVGPRAMAVGDFDNAGKLDLATVNDPFASYYDFLAELSILPGNGDGTFQPHVDSDIWGVPLAVATGDFNADGNTDLVYTIDTFDFDAVEVLLGDGQGGFAASDWHELHGWYSFGLAVADLNEDGKPDVVTAHDQTDNVSVLLGNGDGTLSYSYWGGSEFATGDAPRAVAVGDFTGDGIPDLVTAGQTVDILPGLGDGRFASPIHHSANDTGMTSVAAADFNGDGKLDVVTADPGAGSVSVLLGNANGTLSAPFDHTAGSSPTVVAVGDFNGDGRTDVAAASAGSNAVSVLLNDGAWSTPLPIPRVSINDMTKVEGKKGQTTLFTFTVTLSAPCDQPVTMSFRTVNGTAQTSNNDYVARSGTLTFAPGETTKTITIEVKGDSKREANETFYLDLFGLSGNALFTKSRGIGTILNDE